MSDAVLKKIWSREGYYQKIGEREDFTHPGFIETLRICKNSESILDVGSGDGSKLGYLGNKKTKRVGCDVSFTGLKMGIRKNPKTDFIASEGEQLPFKDDTFERVTCFFVLEHTRDPEKVLIEMFRVTQKKGLVCILTPNFGAPNRASPNHIGSRIGKLLRGIARDLISVKEELAWKRVEPRINSFLEFEQDLDTTVEPYLLSLKRFLKHLPVQIIKEDSFWEMEMLRPRWWQKINRFLGERGLFPFKYWGPHLFLMVQKVS